MNKDEQLGEVLGDLRYFNYRTSENQIYLDGHFTAEMLRKIAEILEN